MGMPHRCHVGAVEQPCIGHTQRASMNDEIALARVEHRLGKVDVKLRALFVADFGDVFARLAQRGCVDGLFGLAVLVAGLGFFDDFSTVWIEK